MPTLFCTLGKNIEIPLEAVSLTCFSEKYDLYADSDEYENIKNLRKNYNIQNTEKVIIFATDQDEIKENCEYLISDIKKNFVDLGLNIRSVEVFVLKDVDDITSNDDSSFYENMIFSVILKSKFENPTDVFYLCIAGGRKTMSSSLQNAGFILGADFVFHLIDKNTNGNIANDSPKQISETYLKSKLKNITPVPIGSFKGNESFINKSEENLKKLLGNYFQSKENIELKEDLFKANIYKMNKEVEIKNIITQRYQEASILYSNWNDRIDSTEDIFRVLYTYNRKNVIDRLKNYTIGLDPKKEEEELDLLKTLPKTDLHCHLGGVLSVEDLLEFVNELKSENKIFSKIEDEIKKTDLYRKSLSEIKDLIKQEGGLKNFSPDYVKKSSLIIYLISLFNNKDDLENFIYQDYLNPKKFKNIGIAKYESLGDIQGSSLLQFKEAISFTTKKCIEKSLENNVKHLEIRCSPINYTKEGLKDLDVIRTILQTMDQFSDKISLSLLIIASRHGKMSDIYKNIELVQSIFEGKDNEIKDLFTKYFKGFDLAGDEEKGKPERFRQAFLTIMDYCPNITIHAGETAESESIWQAVYHLNAERIGHGLSLLQDMNLLKKIRERKIAIELCPSSNYQIKNYYDYYYSSDQFVGQNNPENYPLKDYLNNGIKVTINTDNMGISRTNITYEYLKAARMTMGGLSLWEILKIIKIGFKSAFINIDLKSKLYEEAEKDISSFIDNFVNLKKQK